MSQLRQSATNRQWNIAEPTFRETQAIMQRFELSELAARMLATKKLSLEELGHFLEPKLKNVLPDPLVLLDMQLSIERVYGAILSEEKIVVYADYDVDGATGSALLRRYFQEINYPVDVYIPDRIEEGYGANTQALLKLKSEGAKVIIMVDCGTTAFEPLANAKEAGLDVVVLDHHTAEAQLPQVHALVNPNRLDQPLINEDLRYTCAAGVVYLFLIALNRMLRERNFFKERNQAEPNLLNLLDLVALGTVCDVMPLTGLNRVFVKQGLAVLSQRRNIGLAHLADVAALKERPSAYHLGFLLGPRINAGGRVGEGVLGSHLLSTNDAMYAQQIAMRLDDYNKERQDIEKFVLEQAEQQVIDRQLTDRAVILVGDVGWHPGVIGIVASRLKEKYNRPAMVVGFDDNGEGKGSGRSITGVMMGNTMIEATKLGLLVKGGGHAMAAGFTVMQDQFEAFYDFVCEQWASAVGQYKPTLDVTSAVALSALNLNLVNMVEVLEPFGVGNPQPKFLLKNVRVKYLSAMSGGIHKRCTFEDDNNDQAQVLAFRVEDTPLEKALYKGRHESFDAIVSVKRSSYQGKDQVSVILEDIAF